ncbi:hypothetical protein YC2023_056375 [Brassica napus]
MEHRHHYRETVRPKILSDTRIEVSLKPPFLDAGGVSNRRRRAPRAPLNLSCSRPRLSCVSSDFFVVLVTAKAFVDRSLRRRLSVESQSGWPFIYGPGFTGSGSSWGGSPFHFIRRVFHQLQTLCFIIATPHHR